jgi:putative heme iron utilization protein
MVAVVMVATRCHGNNGQVITFIQLEGANLYERLLSQRKHRQTMQKNLFKSHFSTEVGGAK